MDFYESTVQNVKDDFEKRKKMRRQKDILWQMNLNFLNGKQNCHISPQENVEIIPERFFWQKHECFNHIAPVMEARAAKLLRLRPKVKVNPYDSSSVDEQTAKVCESLINCLFEKSDMKAIITDATAWSEATGTSFYKLSWDNASPSLSNANAEYSTPYQTAQRQQLLQIDGKQNDSAPSQSVSISDCENNSYNTETTWENNLCNATAFGKNPSDTVSTYEDNLSDTQALHESKSSGETVYDNNFDNETVRKTHFNPFFDKINAEIHGDVCISVCPPFEIYPDRMSANDVQDCASLLHARVMSVDDIKTIWNVDVLPEEITAFSTGLSSQEFPENSAMVIERYEKPSSDYPHGRLTIIAGNSLLHDGPLPYTSNGRAFFPFIRQTSLPVAGSFFGASIIERLIPLQRAYNNVKNKKHELLNRLAAGIIAVEEGSVNVDELEEEGLYPGKILVYRQGSPLPEFIQSDRLPVDFANEEERILEEFTVISGVSDFMRSSNSYKASSGTAINLLLEQDNSRMAVSSEQVNSALRKTAYMILNMYHDFAHPKKLLAVCPSHPESVLTFLSQSISAENISIVTENESYTAPSGLKTLAIELYSSGMLDDDNGKLSPDTKRKLLDLLGLNQLM